MRNRSFATGQLNVNLDAQIGSRWTGQIVHLTGKEYQMLELLSLRKGTTLTKGNVPQPPLRRYG